MAFTEQLTQALSVAAVPMAPANTSNSATATTVGPIDMLQFKRCLGLVNVGVLTGTANVQAYFQSSNTSGGTYANVSATNQVVTINTSNTVGTLECRADQLPTNNRYLELKILVNANAAFCDAWLLGGEASYKPASAQNVNATVLPTQLVL